jgi:hypothetical protein
MVHADFSTARRAGDSSGNVCPVGDSDRAEALCFETLARAQQLSNDTAVGKIIASLGILAFHCCAYERA